MDSTQAPLLCYWVGYGVDKRTWEPADQCANSPERIQAFYKKYPQKPGPNQHPELLLGGGILSGSDLTEVIAYRNPATETACARSFLIGKDREFRTRIKELVVARHDRTKTSSTQVSAILRRSRGNR